MVTRVASDEVPHPDSPAQMLRQSAGDVGLTEQLFQLLVAVVDFVSPGGGFER